MSTYTDIPFRKMHGLGNDFVVLDLRTRDIPLSSSWVQAVADRRRGVGCDQFITIETPRDAPTTGAVAFMGIRNADGDPVEACGNAARCIGKLMLEETGNPSVVLETPAGPIRISTPTTHEAASVAGPLSMVSVDMGPALLEWAQIPLAEAVDTNHLPIIQGNLRDPAAVSMGNPHLVFFVEDAEAIALTEIGPVLEHHPLFPQRTNVEMVSRLPDGGLRMRVWERGVGITQACGTGACAVAVAAMRREIIADRRTTVYLDGGPLEIVWQDNGHVLMTGAAALSFTGIIPANLGQDTSGSSGS